MSNSESYLDRMFALQGKVVFITGAAGQLGRALCRAYTAAGAIVVASDIAANLKDKCSDCCSAFFELDIADKDVVTDVFAQSVDMFGGIDILVNNAGVSVFEPFEERTAESFDWVTNVNLKGTFNCIQAFDAISSDTNSQKSIVNIASLYGVVSPDPRIYTDCARKNSEVYGATKAAIIQMTKYFAVHLAAKNIRVNAISPGGIFNPESPQGEDFVKNYSYRCPMGKMADVEDMVGGVLYASSAAAKYLTGQNIVIDGGMTCW